MVQGDEDKNSAASAAEKEPEAAAPAAATPTKKRTASPARKRASRAAEPKKQSGPVDRAALNPFMRLHVREQAVSDAVKAALTVRLGADWPTLQECIPPASLLDEIQTLFLDTTDIPLEIPVFATLHYLSALLLQGGVKIAFAGQLYMPDIWSICLAESGAGKTFAQTQIAKALGGNVALFSDFASSAKFMEELRDKNHGLWLRDEFAQFLMMLEQQPHMQEAKDYLLRCYDNKRIERRTKSDEIVVEEPAITIFGSTVFDSFKKKISEEMLLDGFAQRFAYIVADVDHSREVAIYHTAKQLGPVTAQWQAIAANGFQSEYQVDQLGERAFEEAFLLLMRRASSADIPRSFIRRITFRGVKYALLYHVLLGKTTARLDEQDFGYAARVCALNLRDLRKVLDLFHMSDFQDLTEKAVAFVKRKQAENQQVTPGSLTAGVRGVKNAATARSILEFVMELHPALAKSIHMGRPQQAARAQLQVVK